MRCRVSSGMRRRCRLLAVAVGVRRVAVRRPYPVADFDAVRATWRASDAWLLDRNGEPLSRVRIDHERRRGDWVGAERGFAGADRRRARLRGPALPRARAASTGSRIAGALRQTRGGRAARRQHAHDAARRLSPSRARIGRPARPPRQVAPDAPGARARAARGRKDQMLEAWLNLTPFRGELEGVDAAARSALRQARGRAGPHRERAPRGARALAERLAGRASRAAPASCSSGEEQACLQAQGVAALGLSARRTRARDRGRRAASRADASQAPGRARDEHARRPRSSATPPTTLQRHLRELDGRNVEDGALVVLDNATGEVLAWVGSSGELSRAHEVDGVTAPPPGGLDAEAVPLRARDRDDGCSPPPRSSTTRRSR